MPECIFSSFSQIEASLLKGALDEQKIENHLQNYSISDIGLAGGGVLPIFYDYAKSKDIIIKVLVKEEDAERALEIAEALFG